MVVSTRIPLDIREKLQIKHPKRGDIADILKQLITKYLEGKILGIKIQETTQKTTIVI